MRDLTDTDRPRCTESATAAAGERGLGLPARTPAGRAGGGLAGPPELPHPASSGGASRVLPLARGSIVRRRTRAEHDRQTATWRWARTGSTTTEAVLAFPVHGPTRRAGDGPGPTVCTAEQPEAKEPRRVRRPRCCPAYHADPLLAMDRQRPQILAHVIFRAQADTAGGPRGDERRQLGGRGAGRKDLFQSGRRIYLCEQAASRVNAAGHGIHFRSEGHCSCALRRSPRSWRSKKWSDGVFRALHCFAASWLSSLGELRRRLGSRVVSDLDTPDRSSARRLRLSARR